jgi:hypothetical protein
MIPMELNVGVSCQSAAAKNTKPAQTAKAHVYSTDVNILLFKIDATSMVGMSLQDRNTTLVGKLM